MSFVSVLAAALGKTVKELLPLQLGDVIDTYTDIYDLLRDFDYSPRTTITDGIEVFLNDF